VILESVMGTLSGRRLLPRSLGERKMSKKIQAVASGLVVWVAVGTVGGIIMRSLWPGYASVVGAMTFTLPMLLARLSIGALATLAAGLVASVIAPRPKFVRLMPGLILLAAFIPRHIMLWSKFPIWYHLTFLLSLVPLTYVGGTLSSQLQRNRTSHAFGERKAV
jgi:hypothetical protein